MHVIGAALKMLLQFDSSVVHDKLTDVLLQHSADPPAEANRWNLKYSSNIVTMLVNVDYQPAVN